MSYGLRASSQSKPFPIRVGASRWKWRAIPAAQKLLGPSVNTVPFGRQHTALAKTISYDKDGDCTRDCTLD